jgi:hypothetical protein
MLAKLLSNSIHSAARNNFPSSLFSVRHPNQLNY